MTKSWLPIPMETEFRSCPICSGSDCSVLLEFDSFGFRLRTVECKRCGLLYLNPAPTREFLNNFYRFQYRYFYEGVRRIDNRYVTSRCHAEIAAARVARYRSFLALGASVLDVGCGTGFFLNAARESCGAVVEGIEPDPITADYCEQLRLNVFRGFLEQYPTSEQFDCVAAFHIIEHIADLQQFLTLLKRRLRRNGYLFVETPNCAGSWDGIGMFHIAHLQTFSPRTIANLLSVHGFDIVEAGAIESDVESSNLYVVACLSKHTKELIAADMAESALISEKCRRIRSRRIVRVFRTWAKWLYFRVGGVQPARFRRTKGRRSSIVSNRSDIWRH